MRTWLLKPYHSTRWLAYTNSSYIFVRIYITIYDYHVYIFSIYQFFRNTVLSKVVVSSFRSHLEASEPKWFNPVLNIIRVNSLRLGGLQLRWISETVTVTQQVFVYIITKVNKMLLYNLRFRYHRTTNNYLNNSCNRILFRQIKRLFSKTFEIIYELKVSCF